MASDNSVVFAAYNSSGNPLTGLTPTWTSYVEASTGTAITPQPVITEIGSTGTYKFAPPLTGQHAIGYIDLGAGAIPRNLYYDARYEDGLDFSASLTTIAIDTALARKMSSNKITWNPNTSVMTIYDDDGVTPLKEFLFTDQNNAPSLNNPINRTVIL